MIQNTQHMAMPPTANLTEQSWQRNYTTIVPARPPRFIATESLNVDSSLKDWLAEEFPRGIFGHQADAIERIVAGENACLATSTASGKSLAFMTGAVDRLLSKPKSRVLAIYPQKALANEQQVRWTKTLRRFGLGDAGRVDGSVGSGFRPGILRTSRVVIMTPDVVHAWLLSNLSDPDVRAFLAGVSLLIVDEVHTYTGVFGSNAAFLFRRLEHAVRALGGRVQVFCASATIRDPLRHLKLLFGTEFALIGPEADSSARQPLTIELLTPPRQSDFLTEVTTYLHYLVEHTGYRFIVFVDSRKQTEQVASILGRLISTAADDDDDGAAATDPLLAAAVLPYRAGYEENDRVVIEERLRSGSLRGVISTSALELGIDIPHLDLAVLVGVPRSSTSLQQRIGRVGRVQPGTVVVINSGEIYDEAVFRTPETLLVRPPAEGALYLENTRVQYIHALCLARPGGEHDQLCARDVGEPLLKTDVKWPEGFMALCELERTGQIPTELQAMKAESGDDPNHVFPLRDVEAQFKVELASGPARETKGTVSFGQLLREAYPGAIYYYATRPLRVTRVSLRERLVSVRREKRYSTKPTKLPTQVFPNFGHGNVFQGLEYGDTRIVECNLQVREALVGYRERRGNRDTAVAYPLTIAATGLNYGSSRFSRNYFTTGAILTSPLFARLGVHLDVYSELLFEALLMAAPYERQDLGFATDKIRVDDGIAERAARLVAVFDQTYGSLRLSRRLLEPEVFRRVVGGTLDLAIGDDSGRVTADVIEVAAQIARAAASPPATIVFTSHGAQPTVDRACVIKPGSRGINITNGNTEFHVERVLVHPKLGLAYRGRHDSVNVAGQVENIPVKSLVAIPGESATGWYDFETGDIVDD